jgi:hypothetical protein
MARCLNTGCGGPAARLFPKAAAGWVVSEFGRHGSKRKEAPSPGKDQSAGGGDDEDDGGRAVAAEAAEGCWPNQHGPHVHHQPVTRPNFHMQHVTP